MKKPLLKVMDLNAVAVAAVPMSVPQKGACRNLLCRQEPVY